MLHFVLVCTRQLYIKGLFYCCVEKIKKRYIRSENGGLMFCLNCAHGPCSHKKLNLVELVSVAESYLGSRFTVGVQNCRVWSIRPQPQSYELLSVFSPAVCVTRDVTIFLFFYFLQWCMSRAVLIFCVVILNTKQLIWWFKIFIENVYAEI